MCGIYITNIPFKEKEIETKLEKINYRGPDFTAVIKQDAITLGHLRLAIVDLDARSNQPYLYNDLAIVYNGEIYNFKEVKKELEDLEYTFQTTSDTEVLIKGFDAWGEKILNKLNGMFAFAIYNTKKQEVFCARDRIGVKPLYYYWKNGKFEICSQLQPIFNENSELSLDAISIYLSTGYVPSPFSILEDVYKLQPGCSLNINLNKKTKEIRKYWDLKKVEILDISYDEAKEKIELLLKDAVKIRLQSDVPFGTFLSGGIDSALVTALACEISNEKIKTFTIGFDDARYDESIVAKKYATILDTEHICTYCKIEDVLELIPKLIEVYDEPFADSSALPSLLLSKKTKQQVTVALSGDGGDESFLGYNHFNTIFKFKKLELIPFLIRKSIANFLPKGNKYKYILQCKNEDEFIKRIFIDDQLILNNKFSNWFDSNFSEFKLLSVDFVQKAADLNIKLWLENDSNVKVDRASMAYSVEIRSPFLDYRIVEFARKLPLNYKFRDGSTKYILKDILSKYIPYDVFNNPKSGFSIPIGKWLKTSLKDDFQSTITNDFFNTIPIIDKIFVNKMIKEYFNYKSNIHDDTNTTYIWRLYILSKWINNFNQIKYK
jgi:asparagine synthase (glutamine-hydrolysing)